MNLRDDRSYRQDAIPQSLMIDPHAKFPVRLYLLLENAPAQGFEHIISWMPCGTAFRVHLKNEFEQNIMPRFFNQNHFKSFLRQVNLYGFGRLSNKKHVNCGSYSHSYFVRGKFSLCHCMTRQKLKRGKLQEGRVVPDVVADNEKNRASTSSKGSSSSEEEIEVEETTNMPYHRILSPLEPPPHQQRHTGHPTRSIPYAGKLIEDDAMAFLASDFSNPEPLKKTCISSQEQAKNMQTANTLCNNNVSQSIAFHKHATCLRTDSSLFADKTEDETRTAVGVPDPHVPNPEPLKEFFLLKKACISACLAEDIISIFSSIPFRYDSR